MDLFRKSLVEKIGLSWIIPFSAAVLALRPVFFVNYFTLDELGRYVLILSFATPLAFLIGGANEVKILSDKLIGSSTDIAILKFKNLVYLLIPIFSIFWVYEFDNTVLWVFLAIFVHLGSVTTLALLRYDSENLFLYASLLRSIGIIFCVIVAISLDSILLIIFCEAIISCALGCFFMKSLKPHRMNMRLRELLVINNFAGPYFLNSLTSNADKYFVAFFGLKAVGVFALVNIFVSAGTMLSGVINSFLFHKRLREILRILQIGIFAGLLICVIGFLPIVHTVAASVLPLEHRWMTPVGVFIVVVGILNIMEYVVWLENSPNLLIYQMLVGLCMFVLTVYVLLQVLGMPLVHTIWVSVFVSSSSKLAFLIIKQAFFRNHKLLRI